jgi:dihydrodipicolinate synthase/N-acetylneuraminate lyase
MVGGTTGESTSFSTAERLEAVKAWLAIAGSYDLNVYVHVGMGSI